MSIKTEILQLKVVVDTKDGINNLGYLKQQFDKLEIARKDASSVEIDKELLKAMEFVNKKIGEQRAELGLYGKTVRENQSYMRDMGADLRDMIPTTDKAKEFRAEIEKVREINSGKADAREQKFREIDDLRVMIKDSGAASLSIKQLESVSEHMFNTMKSSAQSGAIENHQFYKEWQNINKVIDQGKDALNKQKVAENAYQSELRETIKTQGIEGVSLTHLKEYYQLLQQEIKDTSDFESVTNKQRIADAQKTEALINHKESQVKQTSSFFSQIKNGLPSAIAGAVGGLTVGATQYVIDGITRGFSNAVKRAADLSDQTADMQKSLEASEPEVKSIVSELGKLDTRTTSKELKEIAVAAGQMGVAKEEVIQFTGAMDKLTVALGDEFKGGGEEITKTIVPLRNIFQDEKTKNIGNDLLRFGNAINLLGAKGLATGPVITDIASRIGASASIYGVSAGQTLGLAAAYQELAISSERGSTATVKILQKIATAPQDFAKIAGMGTKEFTNLVNTNMTSAFLKVAEGFSKSKGKATEFAEKLSDANVSSAAISEVLAKVGSNTGLVTEKMGLAGTALKETSSIMGEFNIRNENFAAKLEKAEKVWNRWMNGLSGFVQTISTPVIDAMAKMATNGKSLTETLSDQKTKVENLTTNTQPLIDRYKELSIKTNKSKEDHAELNQLLTTLQTQLPRTAFEFNNYGVAIALNTQKAQDFIVVQKAMLKAQNATLINQLENDKKSSESKLKELQRLSDGEFKYSEKYKKDMFERKKSNFLENKIITPEEHKKQADLIANLQAEIKESDNAVRGLKGDLLEIPDLPKTKPPKLDGGGSSGTTLSDKEKSAAEKRKREAEARAKYLQESAKQQIELQAKLAFEQDQALANVEGKRVQVAEHTAEQELTRIHTQFKSQEGLVLKESELSLNQKVLIAEEERQLEQKLANEVLAIRKEFAEKREAQILEQSNRAIQIAQSAHTQELQSNLKKAQNKGDSFGVFNAQGAIINNNEFTEQTNLNIKYHKEREALKENKAALAQLEINYGNEKNAITQKYVSERQALLDDSTKRELERDKKTKAEKLKLDITETEQKGGNVTSAKLSLLDFEMQTELSVKDLTEAEKTNIVRKYALERAALEQEHSKKSATIAIEHFQQAFGAIANIASTILQNKTVDEQNHYDATIRNLDSQKDHGILTSRQYNKQKLLIDKEHDKAQRKLKHDQFELDKAANLANIIMKTALAVMNTAATAGPWAVPVTIALGAVEFGLAASQVAPYSVGGNVESVNQSLPIQKPSSTAVLSWLNEDGQEYVVPNWQLNDPVTANLVDVIEYRRANNITGHVQGGFASQNGGGVSNVNSAPITGGISNEEFLKQLVTHIENYKFQQETTKLKTKQSNSYTNSNQSLIQ